MNLELVLKEGLHLIFIIRAEVDDGPADEHENNREDDEPEALGAEPPDFPDWSLPHFDSYLILLFFQKDFIEDRGDPTVQILFVGSAPVVAVEDEMSVDHAILEEYLLILGNLVKSDHQVEAEGGAHHDECHVGHSKQLVFARRNP